MLQWRGDGVQQMKVKGKDERTLIKRRSFTEEEEALEEFNNIVAIQRGQIALMMYWIALLVLRAK